MGHCDQVVPNCAQTHGWMDVSAVAQVAVYSAESGADSNRLDLAPQVQT